MILIRDLYKVLNVSHNATAWEIEDAFHVATEKAKSLNRYQALIARLSGRDVNGIRFAYEELVDPEKRARFDKAWGCSPPPVAWM